MNRTVVVAIVLGAPVACALLAALVLAAIHPAESHDSMHLAHDQMRVIPLCSSSSNSPASSFHSEMATVNARMHDGMELAPSGNVDQDFIRMMIPHHQGAIDMALVLLKYGRDERLRRLAQSIIVEQGQDIAYMRTLDSAPPAEPFATHRIADQ